MSTIDLLHTYHQLVDEGKTVEADTLVQQSDDLRFKSLVEIGNEFIEGFNKELDRRLKKE